MQGLFHRFFLFMVALVAFFAAASAGAATGSVSSAHLGFSPEKHLVACYDAGLDKPKCEIVIRASDALSLKRAVKVNTLTAQPLTWINDSENGYELCVYTDNRSTFCESLGVAHHDAGTLARRTRL